MAFTMDQLQSLWYPIPYIYIWSTPFPSHARHTHTHIYMLYHAQKPHRHTLQCEYTIYVVCVFDKNKTRNKKTLQPRVGLSMKTFHFMLSPARAVRVLWYEMCVLVDALSHVSHRLFRTCKRRFIIMLEARARTFRVFGRSRAKVIRIARIEWVVGMTSRARVEAGKLPAN